ncbi:MAG: TadE/TadG family type IV pilus assembly protein [Anaerolineales bacterium]
MKEHTYPLSERGQSLTEFAISLIFLFILLAGVADFGRAFFAYIIIRDAAQEGAVYGAIAPKEDIEDLKDRIENRVKSAFTDPSDPQKTPLDINHLQINTTIVGDPCADGANGIRVTVDYTIPITTPFLGTVLGSQELPMQASIEDTILSPMCP